MIINLWIEVKGSGFTYLILSVDNLTETQGLAYLSQVRQKCYILCGDLAIFLCLLAHTRLSVKNSTSFAFLCSVTNAWWKSAGGTVRTVLTEDRRSQILEKVELNDWLF